MKGISPTPVHQLNVWTVTALTIEVIGDARAQEHVRNTRYRYEIPYGVLSLGKGNSAELFDRYTDSPNCSITVTNTSTGEAYLPQHRSESRSHPVRLFTILRAL